MTPHGTEGTLKHPGTNRVKPKRKFSKVFIQSFVNGCLGCLEDLYHRQNEKDWKI